MREALDELSLPSVQFFALNLEKARNDKFFVQTGSKLENPRTGTLIDQHMASRDFWDFFMVSQNVNRGTATPIKYSVLHNFEHGNGKKIDQS
jgi:hypothetical protein